MEINNEDNKTEEKITTEQNDTEDVTSNHKKTKVKSIKLFTTKKEYDIIQLKFFRGEKIESDIKCRE